MTDVKRDKRLRPMYVLEILRKYSWKGNSMERSEILGYLQNEYDVECSLRSLHSYIKLLQDNGYPIVCQKVGCYIDDDRSQVFTDAELRMMIDGIMFSKNISQNQAEALITKITNSGTHGFRLNREKFLYHSRNSLHSDNESVLENVDVIHRAIAKEKKISFIYNTYDTSFTFHPKRDAPYVFNPYQMIVNQGRYYVVGNFDKYDNITNCRIDRMTCVKMIDAPAKQKRKMAELAASTLSEYSAQHIYMFSGSSVRVMIRTHSWMMDNLVDWFGKNFKILKQDENMIEATLICNENAMRYWALQYGEYVEVISPKRLRDAIAESVKGMYEIYCGE